MRPPSKPPLIFVASIRASTSTLDSTFGNGRFARNLLEAAIGRHAWRLREVTEPTLEQLRTILAEDLDSARYAVTLADRGASKSK